MSAGPPETNINSSGLSGGAAMNFNNNIGTQGGPGPGSYITALNPNDVLFGRGSGPNDHEGNIRFRSLVGDRKGEYMATNHRQTKAKIARDIVDSVLNENGRFLKKVELAEAKRLGIPKGIDAWTIVDDDTIMEKAKQALRQQRDKIKAPDINNADAINSTTLSTGTHNINTHQSPSATSPSPAATSARKQQITVPSAASAIGQHRGPSSMSTATTSADVLRRSAAGAYGGVIPMHPNPYEPIPIGTNAIVSDAQQQQQQQQQQQHHPAAAALDWRNFNAAINAQTLQGLQSPYPQVDISNVMMQQQQQQQQQQHAMQAPPDRPMQHDRVSRLNDVGGGGGGSRRESIQVHDLMDSFNKMKTKELEKDPYNQSTDTLNTANNESTETMGTIEPIAIGPGKDVPSAAALSMSSSTFSLMRGALQDSSRIGGIDSTAMLKTGEESTSTTAGFMRPDGAKSTPGIRRGSTRQSITIHDNEFFAKAKKSSSDMSMSFSQVWADKRTQYLGDVYEEEEGAGGENQKKVRANPRAVVAMEDDPDNLSTLGKSSMSILNVAMGESQGDTSIMTANESIFSDIGDVEGE